jgi:hypothetical protein
MGIPPIPTAFSHLPACCGRGKFCSLPAASCRTALPQTSRLISGLRESLTILHPSSRPKIRLKGLARLRRKATLENYFKIGLGCFSKFRTERFGASWQRLFAHSQKGQAMPQVSNQSSYAKTKLEFSEKGGFPDSPDRRRPRLLRAGWRFSVGSAVIHANGEDLPNGSAFGDTS